MFDVKLKVKVDSFHLAFLLENEIKETLVKTGLDKPILESLPELQNAFRNFINAQSRPGGAPEAATANAAAKESTPGADIPRSDQELIKFLTNADIAKINKTGDYTTSIQSNFVFAKNNRVRVRMTISDSETFEENHRRADAFFDKATFAIPDSSGRLSYYMNVGANLRGGTKVQCSTDSGNTPKSQRKFDHYKSSNKMPRQNSSEIGRFAEWALTQETVEKIRNGMPGVINITNIMDSIKAGDYQTAEDLLGSYGGNKKLSDLKDKIDNLKTKTNLTPGMEVHANMMELINNLKIQKTYVSDNEVQYDLISVYSEDKSKTGAQFYDEINPIITQWILSNDNKWFDEFVKLAETILKKYSK